MASGVAENSQSEKTEVTLYRLPRCDRLMRDRLKIQHVFPIPGHLVALFGDYMPTPIQGTPVCVHRALGEGAELSPGCCRCPGDPSGAAAA